MFMLLTALKNPLAYIKQIAIVAALAGAAYVVWDYFDTKQDLSIAKQDVARVTSERDSYSVQLESERQEKIRVNDLLKVSIAQKQEVQLVYATQKEKTIEYRNNVNVVHCNLDNQWVQLVNQASVYPYPASP